MSPSPEHPASIRRMFEGLAPSYDFLNDVLTFGLVRGWRRALVRAANPPEGGRVLDVCTGTGRALEAARRAVGPRGRAVGVDFSPAMLSRASGERVLGDALRLPFRDAAFDASVCAFALRDVADQGRLVSEMVRVTRPGGRVAVLEIGRPRVQPFRLGFDVWFRGVAPLVGTAFGQGPAYRFLVRSLAYLPDGPGLRRTLTEAGLTEVSGRALSLGTAVVVSGRVRDG